MQFHDATISLLGKLVSQRTHETQTLVTEAILVFSTLLARPGFAFREPIPVEPFHHLELRWTTDPAFSGCALAAFYQGSKEVILTTSALVSGLDTSADQAVLQQYQSMLAQILRNQGIEPAIDLLTLVERPLIVSTPFPQRERKALEDMSIVADMETCLAAAFFQKCYPEKRD